MFQQLKNKAVSTFQHELGSSPINIISSGTIIEGEITSSGDIRIDGTIRGSVTSKSKVVIGASGIVEGDVHCQSADISGAVKGNTHVAEMLFLKSHARINGDIHTGKLVVEVGASFTGNCNMGAPIKDIKHADKPEEQRAAREKTA